MGKRKSKQSDFATSNRNSKHKTKSKLVVVMVFHITAQNDAVVDVSHLTRNTNSAVPLMDVNHSKSLTEATNNITKIVFHYLVWSFKNMVIMDKPVSPWLQNEKWYAVNKQEASESA